MLVLITSRGNKKHILAFIISVRSDLCDLVIWIAFMIKAKRKLEKWFLVSNSTWSLTCSTLFSFLRQLCTCIFRWQNIEKTVIYLPVTLRSVGDEEERQEPFTRACVGNSNIWRWVFPLAREMTSTSRLSNGKMCRWFFFTLFTLRRHLFVSMAFHRVLPCYLFIDRILWQLHCSRCTSRDETA